MTRRERGFTLIEVAIAVAIVAVVILTAVIGLDGWGDAESTRASARSIEAAMDYARSEAIRTGNHQLLFVSTDALGAPLLDAGGDPLAALVLDDGRPGSPNQNCVIDPGETTLPVRLRGGVALGVGAATAAAPSDDGAGAFASGSTFTDPGGNPASWVLFRPDGVPRAIDGACAIGPVGSGSGGFYLGNAEREAAVVLSALGASRVYTWEAGAGAWK